jgi:hypothetical protein
MSTHAVTTFAVKSWDEKPYVEYDGRKLTRASVVYTYQGDVEGEGSVEYVMAYGPTGSATFVGIERIVGKLAGRTGSYVCQHTGTSNDQGVSFKWVVFPDACTGELIGLSGGGSGLIAGHGPFTISFEYDLA